MAPNTATAEATEATQTLQARALAELQRVTEEIEAAELQRNKEHRDRSVTKALALARLLGASPADIHPDRDAGTVTIEGLVFRGARLVGRCDRCGGETLSTEIGSLYDLGAQLEAFNPDHRAHECDIPAEYVTPAPAPSIGDQLADLIRKIAREEIEADKF